MLNRRARKLKGRIAVSKPAMEFAREYVPGYYEIIPNGIDLESFSPNVSPIDKFCDGKLNILFVGRLESRKGLNYLIEAFKQVKRELPESRLIVAGPGTRLRNKYEKYVKRNGLSDIVFTGRVSSDKLPNYYKTADIFCSPATGRESFGIVLLEAMSVGTPVIASNIDGYASVLTHNAEGLLVPPKDKKSLSQALIYLMNNESLRHQMGAKGIVKAQDYGWKRISQRIFKIQNHKCPAIRFGHRADRSNIFTKGTNGDI